MATEPARDAGEDQIEVVYAQLRALAQQRLAAERPDHTLQATALVHEAYLRLLDAGLTWTSPGAYHHAAAEAMRRILIEHARRRGAVKRGGGRRCLRLEHVLDLADADDPEGILSLDDAISRLEAHSALAGAVVRLRFYAGLSVAETAQALEVSARTVNREWRFGKAWLYRALESES